MSAHTYRGIDLVNGARMEAYGHPLPNHQRIAGFWNVRLRPYLRPGAEIPPHVVAACMRLVKEARLMETPGHEDSFTDIPGYVEVERMILDEQARIAAEADALVERLHAEDGSTDGHPEEDEWGFR